MSYDNQIIDFKESEEDNNVLVQSLNVKKIDIHSQDIPVSFNNEIISNSKKNIKMINTKPTIHDEDQKDKTTKAEQCKIWKQIPIKDCSNFMSEASNAQKFLIDADPSEISFLNLNGMIRRRVKRGLHSRINIDSSNLRRSNCAAGCDKSQIDEAEQLRLKVTECMSEENNKDDKRSDLSPLKVAYENFNCPSTRAKSI